MKKVIPNQLAVDQPQAKAAKMSTNEIRIQICTNQRHILESSHP